VVIKQQRIFFKYEEISAEMNSKIFNLVLKNSKLNFEIERTAF